MNIYIWEIAIILYGVINLILYMTLGNGNYAKYTMAVLNRYGPTLTVLNLAVTMTGLIWLVCVSSKLLILYFPEVAAFLTGTLAYKLRIDV